MKLIGEYFDPEHIKSILYQLFIGIKYVDYNTYILFLPDPKSPINIVFRHRTELFNNTGAC